MTTPPIRRSRASPAASPTNPVDQPARAAQGRVAPELQGPAPLRRRTDLGHVEVPRRPRSNRSLPPRGSTPGTPSSRLPSLHEISLPAIAQSSRASGGSVQGPDARQSSVPSSPLPSLGSLLDADRAWPSISLPASDEPPQAPGRPSPSISGSASVYLTEADFEDDLETVLPKDRQIVSGLVAALREIAAGVGPITAVSNKVGSHFLRDAFERDCQLRPPGADAFAAELHRKLRCLMLSREAADHQLRKDFDAAMLDAGRPAWRRTTDIVQGLLEASALLNPPPGQQAPKKIEVIERVALDREYVANAIKFAMTGGGRLKHGGPGSNVRAILEQVDRMRRHSPDAEHRAWLARWDAFLAALPSASPPRPRGITYDRSVNWPAEVSRAEGLIETLALMRQGKSQTASSISNTRTNRIVDSYGDFTEAGEAWLVELHGSPFAPARRVAGELQRASDDTVLYNRASLSVLFTDLAQAIEDIRNGACLLKKDALAQLSEPDKVESWRSLANAITAQGRLTKTPKWVRILLEKLRWLRRSERGEDRRAIEAFEAALLLPHHVVGAMTPQSLDPEDYRPAQRAPRAGGRLPDRRRLERAMARNAGPRAAPSASVGSVGRHARGQPTGSIASGARSGIGAGFAAGDEVQSHRAAAPGSPWTSLEGALAQAASPSFDLPSLGEGRSPSPSVDFDALPALSGVQLSLDSDAPSATSARQELGAHAAPDDAVRRANATRDWVRNLITSPLASQSLPADFRQALIQQAVDIELELFAHGAPPLRDMLQNNDRRLWRLVSEEQAGTIRQIDEFLRPREA